MIAERMHVDTLSIERINFVLSLNGLGKAEEVFLKPLSFSADSAENRKIIIYSTAKVPRTKTAKYVTAPIRLSDW